MKTWEAQTIECKKPKTKKYANVFGLIKIAKQLKKLKKQGKTDQMHGLWMEYLGIIRLENYDFFIKVINEMREKRAPLEYCKEIRSIIEVPKELEGK